MRGQIAGLEELVAQAERNGALHCAPRELAIARSQLEFASLALDRGFPFKAQAHLAKAEPNARAAELLSPAQECAAGRTADGAVGDRDGDGYPNSTDKCPDQPENFNGFQDQDGCPDDPDTDGDGVPDSVDQCVLAAEDKDGYLDSDGCPDPDNDHDGVPDTADQCPNEVGSATQEPLGCPANRLVVVTDCELRITQQIYFESNQDTIRPESFPILDALVEVLEKNPDIQLEVQGHTDNAGAPAHNKDLSNGRAHSVVRYLIAHGVTKGRLTAVGYGMERPLVENDTVENRSLNRRVQFFRSEASKEGCPKTGAQ